MCVGVSIPLAPALPGKRVWDSPRRGHRPQDLTGDYLYKHTVAAGDGAAAKLPQRHCDFCSRSGLLVTTERGVEAFVRGLAPPGCCRHHANAELPTWRARRRPR